jgi:hypothetical protein
MKCPGCGTAMREVTEDAVLGTTVDIALCSRCRAFWFEPFETIHLTPASTLKLFRFISEQTSSAGSSAFPTLSVCPVCGTRLLLTHDRQRNTPFEYWRCDRGHGRFTPYVEFLKEKDFIRPLSPQQMKELRENVQMVNCSNCGGAIDLTKGSVCPHCGSPISMLDIGKMVDVAKQVQTGQTTAAPPAHLAQNQVAELLASSAISAQKRAETPPMSLVDLGLQSVSDWLQQFF